MILAMVLATPLAAVGLATAGGLALLYRFRKRAARRDVPSLLLWPQPGALTVGHLMNGISNIGTPILIIDKCIQCMDCMRACPSGALAKVSKTELRMGVAVIDEKVCLTYRKKRRCKTCADACREFKAITVQKKGYPFPTVNADKCTGCGACVRRCPEKDKHAIYLDLSQAKRFDPPRGAFVAELESRTEPPNPILTLKEWIYRRVETLANTYGLK